MLTNNVAHKMQLLYIKDVFVIPFQSCLIHSSHNVFETFLSLFVSRLVHDNLMKIAQNVLASFQNDTHHPLKSGRTRG